MLQDIWSIAAWKSHRFVTTNLQRRENTRSPATEKEQLKKDERFGKNDYRERS